MSLIDLSLKKFKTKDGFASEMEIMAFFNVLYLLDLVTFDTAYYAFDKFISNLQMLDQKLNYASQGT